MATEKKSDPSGLTVDAAGTVAYDPSKNVLDLVEAERRRQDDIRDAERRYFDAENAHVKEIVALRAIHQADLRAAESARLDSIRQVDREDVAKTAASTQTATTTLDVGTKQLAETLRNQVATVAAAAEARLGAFSADVNKRLSALELSSSEGKGKQTMADPQMEKLTTLVETLARSQSAGVGKSEGMSEAMKMAIGIGTFITILITIGTFLFITLRQPASPIYVPAPAGTALPATPPQGIPR